MVYKLLHGPWIMMSENYTIGVGIGVQDMHCIPLPPDLLRFPYPMRRYCQDMQLNNQETGQDMREQVTDAVAFLNRHTHTHDL